MRATSPNLAKPRTADPLTGVQRDAAKCVDARSVDHSVDHRVDSVEHALEKALDAATASGRWDVVVQLARELEARRVAPACNILRISAAARRGAR